MNSDFIIKYCGLFVISLLCSCHRNSDNNSIPEGKVNKMDGYYGIWYMNTPLNNEYKFKYSGGLSTYCAKHKPFAIYSEKSEKTFFCYGGTKPEVYNDFVLIKNMDGEKLEGILYHMVSYYDHKTGMVPKPTILLDKMTKDAHDNPVLSIDEQGYVWVFSTSHGTDRPSYIHKSTKPFDIDEFEEVQSFYLNSDKKVAFNNFSYFQVWNIQKKGFTAFFTKYNYPVDRTICFLKSEDGIMWSEPQVLSEIEKGSYQISCAGNEKIATVFNIHPDKEKQKLHPLNYRTNLYYIESIDNGETWQNMQGELLTLPLSEIDNKALIKDYFSIKKVIYLKDLRFDKGGNPVVLFLESNGYESGPHNDPRIWKVAHVKENQWLIDSITISDNNYDMGSLYIEDNRWIVIAPTAVGPQKYNTGGEVVIWESIDDGINWQKRRQITNNSVNNHTYVRKPTNANPEFYAFWADGNGRHPSSSNLLFCNKQGHVYCLPKKMRENFQKPKKFQ